MPQNICVFDHLDRLVTFDVVILLLWDHPVPLRCGKHYVVFSCPLFSRLEHAFRINNFPRFRSFTNPLNTAVPHRHAIVETFSHGSVDGRPTQAP